MAYSKPRTQLAALLPGLLACATTTSAGAGDGLPSLVREDGGPAALAHLSEGHDAAVLVWWSTTCPCARRYEGRVKELAARYGEKVAVYAVVAGVDETPARVTAVRAERGFDVPLLHDPGARLATALGVRATPTAVVLDRRGEVAFRGWIDNERLPGEPDREAYVEEVLDAELAGHGDHRKKSPTWGCPITRSLTEDVPDCCRAAAQ